MQSLKERTRIYVPKAVLLMGVMDELSVLEPGELFLSIDPQNGRVPGTSPQVITGPVIMGRNPCFHPGDIRRLQVFHALVLLHTVCHLYGVAPDLGGSRLKTMSRDTLAVFRDTLAMFEDPNVL